MPLTYSEDKSASVVPPLSRGIQFNSPDQTSIVVVAERRSATWNRGEINLESEHVLQERFDVQTELQNVLSRRES